ncbi:unnamed protein product [Durusdinium trenchii]|uniref:Tyrosine-protein kinase ephrin type A/B receptor-like domain-containing protein n=1 Tax=Durusdinium trenchii TaxID=1381693 RepID=A0ABP0L5C6_9DINO
MHGYETQFGFAAVALCLLPGVLGQGQTVPCIDDCLAEALASVPTKGCAAGTYWRPYPESSPVDSCQPCPLGAYCPGIAYGNFTEHPVNLNRRILCPTGTFRNITGGSTLEDCELCHPGYFSGSLGLTACENCPAGRYSITSGSSKLGDCLECPAGHHCSEACSRPVPCPAGSYAPLPGLANETECLNCTLGHWCQIGAVEPLGCAAGTFGNSTRLRGNGSAPGAFLPTPWTDITPSGLYGTDCLPCPAAAFCPHASVLPTQCPAGTFQSNTLAESEAECEECPEGFRCRMPLVADLEQSNVARLPDGQPVAGTAVPEVCEEDEVVIHHFYPNVTGCVENCPYQFPRQSYCHVAGDGRVPDRTSTALMIDTLVEHRGENRPLQLRQDALSNLIQLLDNLTSEEAADSLLMLDQNGRAILHKAAMFDDVELLEVLWQYGGAGTVTLQASRDSDGFTAVMQALLLENSAAVAWLISKGSGLTDSDAQVLTARGVNITSVPSITEPSAPRLGRGSFAWTGPSGEDFGGLPKVSPMPNTTTWVFTTTTAPNTTLTTT